MTQHSKKKNWLEWSVFATGLLLVAALLGYLLYDALTSPSGPPRIDLRLGTAERRLGHYAIPVTVINRGHTTASAVHIRATLKPDQGKAEESSFEVQYLPGGATRRGFLVFDSDPARAERLSARVSGYEQP